ncbi:MAG TPA: FHA domain-containing protein [Archangium sp.]|uniref:FHA domain-containing protein n=1 Tax=Archangium sp. TaxID=1872627 RepID=UPI002E331CBB|nr:FHA domain-containing protein [Archangium sp.]HEX5750437.1 FHA domain-containing protein [Archangium sp.]
MSQLLLSALAVVCPNCDGYNPPRAEVCASCGTSLSEAPATAKPPPSRTPPASSPGKPGASTPRVPPGLGRPPESPPGLRPAASRTPPPVASAGGIPLASRAAPGVAAPRSPAAPLPLTRPAAPPSAPPVAAPKPAVPASGARPVPAASRFGLAVVAGSTRGQRFKLPVTGCTVGRTRGAILFADDVFVSAQHATFLIKDNVLHVRDESSASGVYVTIPGAETIPPMSFFSAGQRLFRFLGKLEAPPPLAGRPTVYGAPVPPGQGVYGVEEVLVGGRSGRTVVTSAPLLTIGQANCDFSYPQEEGLAGRHCELSFTPAGAQLRDLSGGLGTYVRIAPSMERPLRPGDRVRLGQHIVQVELMG